MSRAVASACFSPALCARDALDLRRGRRSRRARRAFRRRLDFARPPVDRALGDSETACRRIAFGAASGNGLGPVRMGTHRIRRSPASAAARNPRRRSRIRIFHLRRAGYIPCQLGSPRDGCGQWFQRQPPPRGFRPEHIGRQRLRWPRTTDKQHGRFLRRPAILRSSSRSGQRRATSKNSGHTRWTQVLRVARRIRQRRQSEAPAISQGTLSGTRRRQRPQHGNAISRSDWRL